MSICLATKGMICPAPLIIPARTPFSPILRFDVELVLDKPIGLFVEDLDTLAAPKVFRVEDLSVTMSTPKGFFVENGDNLDRPRGFTVTDDTFVSTPVGFAVEDI